jgi:ribonucrease Y
METFSPLILGIVSLAIGGGLGYLIRDLLGKQSKNSIELKVQQLLLEARSEAKEIELEAKNKAVALAEEAKQEEKRREEQVRKVEERVARREELVDKKYTDLDRESKELQEKVERVKAAKAKVDEMEAAKQKELERVANLSKEEAAQQLISVVEKNIESDILARIQKLEMAGQESLERKAKDILAAIVHRLGSSAASEFTTTSVTINSEDIKGKIIGREGRNIRTLERAAGVEIIVDDTPGTIIISGFDPVRRHIAKMALENLISDGRIQPARIEEMVEKAKQEMDKLIKEAGEAAAYEVGIFDLDARLIHLIGRLKFRTSYGQNVLQHSIEMAHISGMLASELGADVQIAKKGALLHDIGKAVDHEVQGTHVEIGRRILQKFKVDHKVVQAMQSHHEEYPYETLESIIVQVADAISAGRPGARRDTVENYLKRLEELETIAGSFAGVEKSYAIQAGREIRIFVSPDNISDLEAKKLARDIANRIESELKYPGEIKVNVIRETRAIEYAR